MRIGPRCMLSESCSNATNVLHKHLRVLRLMRRLFYSSVAREGTGKDILVVCHRLTETLIVSMSGLTPLEV